MTEKEPLILDTSAIINGISGNLINCRLIVPSSVIEELGDEPHRLNLDKVEERNPEKHYLVEVEKQVEKTGDVLSKTDKDILAIAMQYKASIATDDYGIQNIAKLLNIDFESVGEEGIKEVFHWTYYCPACYIEYEGPGTCEICGTKLKRKVKKKK